MADDDDYGEELDAIASATEKKIEKKQETNKKNSMLAAAAQNV